MKRSALLRELLKLRFHPASSGGLLPPSIGRGHTAEGASDQLANRDLEADDLAR